MGEREVRMMKEMNGERVREKGSARHFVLGVKRAPGGMQTFFHRGSPKVEAWSWAARSLKSRC